MQVNYPKAADIATLLKQKTAGAKGKNENLLSSRGSVSVDERTNTLLVQDTGDKLTEIKGLIGPSDSRRSGC
ncbi:MAG: secretin N-terminal domain-containing protein [Microthrixaceae bacterium]